jgi:hypothetical protein
MVAACWRVAGFSSNYQILSAITGQAHQIPDQRERKQGSFTIGERNLFRESPAGRTGQNGFSAPVRRASLQMERTLVMGHPLA